MIENVTTSGKSMEETVPKVKGAADRKIRTYGILKPHGSWKRRKKCALDEVKDLYGFDTAAIVSMDEVVEYLYNRECQGRVIIDDTLQVFHRRILRTVRYKLNGKEALEINEKVYKTITGAERGTLLWESLVLVTGIFPGI